MGTLFSFRLVGGREGGEENHLVSGYINATDVRRVILVTSEVLVMEINDGQSVMEDESVMESLQIERLMVCDLRSTQLLLDQLPITSTQCITSQDAN